jgi:transposase-like protein
MKLTPEKLTAFCAALAETAQVSKACAAVGISRVTAYKWRKENLDFALAWDEALQVAVSALEDEAIRRAHEGVDEPLVHQGQFTPLVDYEAIDPLTNVRYIPQLAPVKRNADGSPQYATVKRYSDTLLIFTLKAHAPAKYRENTSIELTGKDGGAVQFNATEQAARVAALVGLAQKRATERDSPSDDISDLI